MKSSVCLALVLVVACGCSSESKYRRQIPEDVPEEAHPVWLKYKAREVGDFDLFVSVLSEETRDVLAERVGLRKAFGEVKLPGPLAQLKFGTSRQSYAEPGMTLKEGYAFVRVRYEPEPNRCILLGSVTKKEHGAWRLYAGRKGVRELCESVPKAKGK